jgi:hypothetical protein
VVIDIYRFSATMNIMGFVFRLNMLMIHNLTFPRTNTAIIGSGVDAVFSLLFMSQNFLVQLIERVCLNSCHRLIMLMNGFLRKFMHSFAHLIVASDN